jgi:hypothetical protein
MAGFTNDIMNADNVNFTGANRSVGTVTTDGQLMIGSTVSPNIKIGSITSSSLSVGYSDPNITINTPSGGAPIEKITGNSGGAQSPSSGNFNIIGTGSITSVGTANTETVQLTGLTNHNLLIGAGTATITKVAPSATSGIPVISQGAASDPTFGTAVVAGGGTGQVTLTNHGVLVGAGTTAITQLSAGTAGQVLQSGGASADPAYSTATYPSTAGTSGNVLTSNGTNWISQTPSAVSNAFNQIVVQVFTTPGANTYTPTAGMKYCVVECVGGGGGGGGSRSASAGVSSAGSGGGGGGYSRTVFTAADIGSSQTATVGSGGAGGNTSGSTGGTGGTSSLGSLISSSGGSGGQGGAVAANAVTGTGGAGGVGSGQLSIKGSPGSPAFGVFVPTVAYLISMGAGGDSFFGAGGQSDSTISGVQIAGQPGVMGGGGSGSLTNGIATAGSGGVGGNGIIVITEFISV